MNSWAYIAGGLCLLMLCFLLWKEITRINKGRITIRVIATLLAVVSLYLMAIPVMYAVTGKTIFSNEAILLTEGADSDSLSKFINKTSSHHIPV